MNTYSLLSFLFLAIYLYMGIKVLLNDHKNRGNIVFSIVCLSMVIWSLFLGFAYMQETSVQVHFFLKLAYIGKYFFFPLNLHFFFILTKTRSKLWLLIPAYAPAIILNIINASGYSMFSNITIINHQILALFDYGWIFLYVFSILFCFSISFYIVFKWGKKTKINKEKIHSKIILVILTFSYTTALILTILLPLSGYMELQSIGVSFFYLYVIGLFYLVSKFRFMSINYSLTADEIISNINDIVILLDLRLKIIDANAKFEQILSIAPEKIKGKLFCDIIVQNDEVKRKCEDLISDKINSSNLRLNYRKENEYVITRTTLLRIKDKFGDLAGFLVISSEVKEIKQFQNYFRITNRELEIIELIICGLTYRDISDKLSIAEKTVEKHLFNIYNKLGINNKIELIRITGDFNIKPALSN